MEKTSISNRLISLVKDSRIHETFFDGFGILYIVIYIFLGLLEYAIVGAFSLFVGLLIRFKTSKWLLRYLEGSASLVYALNFLILSYANLSLYGLTIPGVVLFLVFILLLFFSLSLAYYSLK